MAGLGRHHHPITTSNPRAQQFFDQGFTLVYAFNHEEAVRSSRFRTDSRTPTILSVSSAGFPSRDHSFQGRKFIRLSAYSVAASRLRAPAKDDRNYS